MSEGFWVYTQEETDVAIQAAVAAALPPGTISSIQDDIALLINRGCSSLDHPLRPRQSAENLPPHFPSTLSQLSVMPVTDIDPFLICYCLPIDGTVEAKRRILALFLGVPALFLCELGIQRMFGIDQSR
jgi:hypothetical protein